MNTFNLEFVWRGPSTQSKTPKQIQHFQADTAQYQRRLNPEIHYMVISEVQPYGKFKLETPWGAYLDGVGCADWRLQPYLKEGMSVVVRYDRVNSNEAYIRALAPISMGRPSEL